MRIWLVENQHDIEQTRPPITGEIDLKLRAALAHPLRLGRLREEHVITHSSLAESESCVHVTGFAGALGVRDRHSNHSPISDPNPVTRWIEHMDCLRVPGDFGSTE